MIINQFTYGVMINLVFNRTKNPSKITIDFTNCNSGLVANEYFESMISSDLIPEKGDQKET